MPVWVRRHGAAALLFAALAALFTFPLVIRLGSHVLGYGDAEYFVWELWWFHQAVVERGTSPLTTDMIFHPTAGVPLVWSGPLTLLAGIGLVGALGPVLSYNVLALGGLALSGFGAYLLAFRLVGRRDAAVLAGMIFAFSPGHMVEVTGHLTAMMLQWVPFCALALLRFYESPSWRRAGLFALTLALVLLTDAYVAFCFLIVLALSWLPYHLLTDRAGLARPAFLGKAALASILALLAALPFYLPTFKMTGSATNRAIQETVHRFSVDVAQLLAPPPTHPLLGWASRPFAERVTTQGDWAYLGWTVLALGALALWRARSRAVAFWAVFAAVGLLLALGTTLHLAGPTGLPLPYMALSQLPVVSSFRVPSRIVMIAMLGLAMLAAAGAAWWFGRLGARSRPVALAIGVAIAVEFLTMAPFPTTSAAMPDYYRTLASEPGVGALLEFPNGTPDWGGPTTRWMRQQTMHGLKLVNGATHRPPDGAYDFIRGSAIASALVQSDGSALADLPAAERPAEIRKLADAGVTHVIVHRWPGMFEGPRLEALIATLVGFFGPPVHRDAEMAVFRTAPGPSTGARSE